MNDLKIEKIESELILEKCADILVNAYNSEPWNDKWTKEKALEKLVCFYNSPKFIGFTATLNNTVLGCVIGNIEPYYTGDYYYLKEMFISVQSQKKGVGAKLLSHVKAHLKTIDINAIILFTGKDFFPFDFYLKSGFNEMAEMRMMHFGEKE